jgi:hypothetical protein
MMVDRAVADEDFGGFMNLVEGFGELRLRNRTPADLDALGRLLQMRRV